MLESYCLEWISAEQGPVQISDPGEGAVRTCRLVGKRDQERMPCWCVRFVRNLDYKGKSRIVEPRYVREGPLVKLLLKLFARHLRSIEEGTIRKPARTVLRS